MATAKLFWNGRSQAVRLPKEFRFDADEVTIRRQGNAVVLEPVTRDDWAWLREVTGPIDPDFREATEESEGSFEDRPDRDAAFK